MRRNFFHSALAASLVLSACQTKPLVGPPSRPASPGPKASSPVGLTASTAPQTVRRLQPPKGASTEVSGIISIDAAYLVQANAGQIISNDGASVVSAGAGNIISNDGASIVSRDGTTLVSGGAGNIIANDGASIISNDGASLIGQDGAGIISGGGGNYRIFVTGGPAVGTAYPAAGMAVRVISMATNQAVPLGVDENGQPAYVVYSDRRGAYKLFLPPGQQTNVRIVASVRGGDQDVRQNYNLVTLPKDAKDQVYNEQTAMASFYLRQASFSQFEQLLIRDAVDNFGGKTEVATRAPDLLRDAIKKVYEDLSRAANEAGIAQLSPGAQRYVSQRIADVLLSEMNFAEVTVRVPESSILGQPVLTELVKALEKAEKATQTRLASGLRDLNQSFFVRDINRLRVAQGLRPEQISKPADLGRLVAENYLGSIREEDRLKVQLIFEDLGLKAEEYAKFADIETSLTVAILEALLKEGDTPADSTQAKMIAVIKQAAAEAKAREAAGQVPATVRPSPFVPVPENVQVTTLAGTGTPGGDSASAATAQFSYPDAVAVSSDGQYLWVAETEKSRLRRVTLGKPEEPVLTLGGRWGTADGPASRGSATFGVPSGLAFDDAGHLYIADQGGANVRMLDTNDPTFPVVTIAGDPEPPLDIGHQDGLGQAARFQAPYALAFDSAGQRLLVSESQAMKDPAGGTRLRAIALGSPGYAVTTLAGFGQGRYQGGPGLESRFAVITGIAAGPGGQVYVSDSGNQRIRLVDPDHFTSVLAGTDKGSHRDAFWASSWFNNPTGLVRDHRGDLLVADRFNNRIRRIHLTGDLAGWTTTIAGFGAMGVEIGNVSTGDFKDGPGASAMFRGPSGLAIAKDGKTVYVADRENHRIRVVKLP